ncbi:hypothetical protein Ahy_B10g105679 [Arachis hypogaea]|uniref:EF-hand domain-containing protein n=1 Tax=Arachis hypogaea TaxID=3818 RepID=A0A444X8K2_ARAHY|nr:hypothetical protein Ahy_B10g105679 [Arachis hypogaea]
MIETSYNLSQLKPIGCYYCCCKFPSLRQCTSHHQHCFETAGLPTTQKTFQLSPSFPHMDTGSIWWAKGFDSVLGNVLFNIIVDAMQTLELTDWWLCNSTPDLEPQALSYLPKLLPVGPLLRSYDDNQGVTKSSLGQFLEEDLSCINWLDQQPHASVIYLAFGSLAHFDKKQFTELALGLELTNRPFLWVVRQDSNCNPHEFKGNQGKIVEWAPQQKVLSHPAIACFVSHCGWNSTIEGLSNGVPFLCWPCFGDQFFNKTYICDELKVGLGFDLDENGLISREEIKVKVDKVLSDENIRSNAHGCNIIFVTPEFIHNKMVSSMGNQGGGDNGGSPIKLVSIPDGLGPDADRKNIRELFDSILNNMPAMLERLN